MSARQDGSWGSSSSSDGGSASMCCDITLITLSPMNGGRPVSSSNRVAPNA